MADLKGGKHRRRATVEDVAIAAAAAAAAHQEGRSHAEMQALLQQKLEFLEQALTDGKADGSVVTWEDAHIDDCSDKVREAWAHETLTLCLWAW